MKNAFIMLLVGILFLSLITVFYPIQTCSAAGDTLHVGSGQTYSTIQAAINAANESGGDTVYVHSGTYYENVVISKNLILTGENRDATIIDGGKNGHVIDVNGQRFSEIEFHISGFTIQNAGGTGFDCIALSFVNNGNINNNKIINSEKGDGIAADHCNDLTISNNLIGDNGNGAGISLTLSQDNSIYDNTIQSNIDGIYIYKSSNNNKIYDNTITGNTHYGIHISPQTLSSGNYFYLNDLKSNGQNAKDPHTNYWSYGPQGNYWDDYNNYDNNDDGIGDVPYDIDEDTQDMYPLGYFLGGNQNSGQNGQDDQDNQNPTAEIITIYPTTATYGEEVYFYGIGTDPDGDSIVEFSWRSDKDGFLSSDSPFTKSNLSIGTHTIYFKIKDNRGNWSDEDSKNITVNPSSNEPPVADAGGPYTGYVNVSISFNASGSYDPDGDEIVSYEWDFGDGTNGTGVTIEHTYKSVGNYTVNLTLTDSEENPSTVSTYVNVSLPPSDQDGNGGEDGGTPGFELLLAVMAIVLVLFWKRHGYIKK